MFQQRLALALGSQNTASTTLLTNLVSYWKLDEVSNGSAPVTRVDSILASGNDLTDNNTTPSAAGKISNAINPLLANSEFLSHASNASLQTGNIDFTLTAWVQISDKAANRSILSKGSIAAVTFEHTLWYQQSIDRFKFWVSDNGANIGQVAANSLGVPALNTWYFIASWYDSVGQTVNIKVNNGTTDTVSYTLGVTTNTRSFQIASDESALAFFSGLVDEVGFWKRVLTVSELGSLYNGGAGLSYPF